MTVEHNSSTLVPEFNSQSKDLPRQLADKCPAIIKKFEQAYDAKPDFVSRSPGRVNLIGEHIDYADFSVLPLAIDIDMLCAVKVLEDRNPSITLTNADERFAQRKFDLPLDGSYVEIDPSISDWSNYFKCGLYVAQEFLKDIAPEKFEKAPLAGLQVFCEGNVPTGSGLSSSAAFICAVALAVVKANMGSSYKMTKKDLTRITVPAEHLVGVNNGGMDQSASVCGEENNALYVEFKPELKATPFKFPTLKNSDVGFVIANTLVVSNKVETGPTNYNLRVVEVTAAANILGAKYGVRVEHEGSSSLNKGNLRDFMDAYYAKYHNAKKWDGDVATGIERLTKMLELVEETFAAKKDGYSVDEAAKDLKCSREEFTKDYLTTFPVRFQVLKLYQRAKHVYAESLRVLKALTVMTSSKFESDADFFQQFGSLMNQSQESCNKLYECSCPEIDQICTIALENGSYGSRLTGAGWGGCTVHLVPSANVEKVKKALIDQYYKVKFPEISEEKLNEALIVSKPVLGSCLYQL
ncbi:hypothetical protein KAFR_0F02420 [Kazachstania africana CBS 2517]|uniref:Galactokinase n=1 Tax=Kazachstania africana (strain ATCC 22294 / BCRC 22015 / CBS 2517 / CECT 1963 / NBRC 1671 / NRRL Y-8276) TaxID=1071382 RepID=H2AWT9_KAZAF|nr:hypothetical protein KAFR_0F02420 [Kazachstania africana CBS 2517]CCF58839.1 hypothetical protein KAFR_0F02420 [Kazachstania africana CBS 2517]